MPQEKTGETPGTEQQIAELRNAVELLSTQNQALVAMIAAQGARGITVERQPVAIVDGKCGHCGRMLQIIDHKLTHCAACATPLIPNPTELTRVLRDHRIWVAEEAERAVARDNEMRRRGEVSILPEGVGVS